MIRFLFIIIISIAQTGFAQENTDQTRNSTGGYYVNTKDGINVDGSNYLNDSLSYGIVYRDNLPFANYYMRYNVVNDQIEFNSVNNELNIEAMPNDLAMKYSFDGREFRYFDHSNKIRGIFEIIKEFDNNDLLVKKHQRIIRKPDKQDVNSYYSGRNSKIASSSRFYYFSGGKFNELNNQKDNAVKSLDTHKRDELNMFIINNNLVFEDDGIALSKLIEFYLSIK